MKYSTLLSSVALMTSLLFSCTKDIPVGSQDDVLNIADVEAEEDAVTTSETLELINNHRSELGLAALLENKVITKEASDHNDYMIYRDEVSHDYFYERESHLKNTISAVEVAENVAYAYNSAEAVMNAWLKSEEHKGNIEGSFSHFGISVKKNAEGRLFYTSIFVSTSEE